MRLLSTVSLRLFAAALLAVALVGCDSSPSSVNDIDIQPDLQAPSSFGIVLIGGTTSAEFEVAYQGLDSAPTATGTGSLSLEAVEESGSPEQGSQVWRASYAGQADGIVTEQVVVEAGSGGATVADTIDVTVSPFAVTTNFQADLATVADFEDGQRSRSTTGGTTISEISNVSDFSNGQTALEVTSDGTGSVLFEREASAPNSDRFSFLVRPSPTTSFNLTLTFTAEVNGATETYDYTLPVPAGQDWLQYGIGFAQISPDFTPVAPRAGGPGSLLSIEMAPDADVTFAVDELFLATETASQVEIEDFERTTNAYGSFSAITLANTTTVGPEADGPTGRSMSYTTGGNFFGYNYSRLFLQNGSNGSLSLRIGEVSRAFKLFAFVETDGAAGGYEFGSGIEVPIEAGADYRTVEIPLTDLGTNAGALANPGITNVGFEIRRAEDDGTNEAIEFIIDDIRLESGN